jgi:uncharacterized membrane-anchored protein
MASTVMGLATTVEGQGLNSLIGGFSFASALAWFAVVQAIVQKYVKSGPGVQAHLIAALLTTLLSIIVFMIIKALAKNVTISQPSQPIFAVTGA